MHPVRLPRCDTGTGSSPERLRLLPSGYFDHQKSGHDQPRHYNQEQWIAHKRAHSSLENVFCLAADTVCSRGLGGPVLDNGRHMVDAMRNVR